MNKLLFLFLFFFISCTIQREIDPITGVVTSGNGLSFEKITLTDENDQLVEKKDFIYGEQLFVYMEKTKDFKKNESGYVFPGMGLYIVSNLGDTVLKNTDAYANYTDGIQLNPLVLQSKFTFANPVRSGVDYTLFINVWDKQAVKHTYNLEYQFSLKSNPNIEIQEIKASVGEVFLYSPQREKIITRNNIHLNESMYVVLEGIKGFQEKDGLVQPGLQMLLSSPENDTITFKPDLFEGNKTLNAVSFFKQFIPQIVLREVTTDTANVYCNIKLWDKIGKGALELDFELHFE